MAFCTCVDVGLRRGFSLREERVPEPPARVRETFPSSREEAEFPIVKLGRLVLVAVATA